MEQKIKLATVLSEIDRYAECDQVKEFSLTFITKEGKRVHRKRMAKSGKNGATATQPTGRSFYNVKEKGVLHVYNLDQRRTETPLICLLERFNGIRIWH